MALNKMEPIWFTPPPIRGRYTRGLWKDSPSPPAAPDPNAVAAAQGKANEDAARLTAQLSRYNQVTPFGTSTWTQAPANVTKRFDEAAYNKALAAYNAAQATGGNESTNFDSRGWGAFSSRQSPTVAAPNRDDFMVTESTPSDQWTNTFQLDPHVQSMLDTYYQKANTALPTVDTSKLPAMGNVPVADEAARKAIQDAYYNQETSRLDPMWQQQEAALRSRLANQGITEGSEAYNNEIGLFGRNRNDAYNSAINSAITNSTNELGKQYGMQLGSFGASQAARNQALQEQQLQRSNALGDRESLLNELMALGKGQQVQAPGGGGVNVAAAPVAQSIYNSYQGNLNNYNQQVASNNSFTNGLFNLGGAAIGSGLGSDALTAAGFAMFGL